MHDYICILDLARTYAPRNPAFALQLAREAHDHAIKLHRPDLAFVANDLIAALAGVLS